MDGFYSPTTWDRVRQPLSIVRECGACGLHKHCMSPFMKPTGEGRRKVLILAEAPGENEDRQGRQLCGNAGNKLMELLTRIGVNMRVDCWLDNAVVCRPWEEKEEGYRANRTPTQDEINHCRPGLVQTLKEFDPDVIIPLGVVALKSLIPLAWKDGMVHEIEPWVGWQIPCVKLNAWIIPTYHPSFLLHAKSPAAELHVTRHLKAAFQLQGKPWQVRPDHRSRVQIELDPDRAAARIREYIRAGSPLSFDYETNMLKPDSGQAEILCFSVSDGETALACPFDHLSIRQALKDLLVSPVPKYGAMLSFEERWSRRLLGVEVNNWAWDTVIGAHWSDCRGGICSVKFQSFVLFGAEDYDSSIDKLKSNPEDLSNEPNQLRQVDMMDLLLYCGMDSLYEYWIAQRQMETGGIT